MPYVINLNTITLAIYKNDEQYCFNKNYSLVRNIMYIIRIK